MAGKQLTSQCTRTTLACSAVSVGYHAPQPPTVFLIGFFDSRSSSVSGPDGWVAIGFHTSSNFPVNKMGPGDFYIGSVVRVTKSFDAST